MKILIIGGGFLGTRLYHHFSKNHEVVLATLNQKNSNDIPLDATNPKEVDILFEKIKPKVVIHTVALTSSVACENNPDLAKKLNFETTKNVAQAARKFNSKIFFISSSYLFDGLVGNYLESDEPKSSLVYSKYKIQAEKEVLKLKDSVVLRVDIMYGYNSPNEKNSFLDSILNELEITIGNPNQIRSPVLVEDVAKSILEITDKNASGIFNIVGDEKIKHLDFLNKLSKGLGKNPKIKIMKESDLSVKPLNNSSLNNSKIKSLGIKFHSLGEGINLIEARLVNSS